MTPQQQRAYDAYEHEIRIEKVLDMAVEAALTPNLMRLSETLADDLLGDMVTSKLHPSMQPLADYLLSEGEEDDDVQLAMDDMAASRPDLMGVCLQVATPVRQWDEAGESSMFSWGYCRLNWVFGPTYDDAWCLAVEWAKKQAEPPKSDAGDAR